MTCDAAQPLLDPGRSETENPIRINDLGHFVKPV
jgi:hypothetical protein